MNINLINKSSMLFIAAPILIPINLFMLLWSFMLIYSGYVVNNQSTIKDSSYQKLHKNYIPQGLLILLILFLCNYYIIKKIKN